MTRRNTGFPDAVKAIVNERSSGCCERCSRRSWDMQHHHRRARGMGSTRRTDTNAVSACVLLCGDCHRWVESHRTQAGLDGWLVLQAHSPVAVPVVRRGVAVWLNDDGSVTPVRDAVGS